MAKNMILFNTAMGIVATMRAKTELLSHTCKDKQIDTVCDDMLSEFDDIELRVAELFADVEPVVQEEKPEPELLTPDEVEEVIAEAEETLALARIAVIDAGNEEEYVAAQEAVSNAIEALETLLSPAD